MSLLRRLSEVRGWSYFSVNLPGRRVHAPQSPIVLLRSPSVHRFYTGVKLSCLIVCTTLAPWIYPNRTVIDIQVLKRIWYTVVAEITGEDSSAAFFIIKHCYLNACFLLLLKLKFCSIVGQFGKCGALAFAHASASMHEHMLSTQATLEKTEQVWGTKKQFMRMHGKVTLKGLTVHNRKMTCVQMLFITGKIVQFSKSAVLYTGTLEVWEY